MFETVKVSFSLLSLKMSILSSLFITLIKSFCKNNHACAGCKLRVSIYFNSFPPACINLVQYTFEPCEQENYQFSHFHLVKRNEQLR